ncbi:MAG: hypothetical protein U0T85_02225 [Cloacibacterium normanense]
MPCFGTDGGLQLRKLTTEEAEFIKFRDKELPEKILETACAFLNSKGKTIILGQTREMRQKNSTRKLQDDLLIIEKALEVRVSEVCSEFKMFRGTFTGNCVL